METAQLGRSTPFYFDRAALQEMARQHAADFRTAKPFRHAVIDGFLPEDVIDELIRVYPSPHGESWTRFYNPLERKFALSDEALVPPQIKHVLQQFNSQVFVDFLERLTGIEGLIPDPHLVGGGLHQIERDGLLKVHADFNRHPRLNLERRLNVLLYLNRDWQEEYGGQLELWDRQMSRAVTRILPVANRMVVFATTATSYHGHPDPLTSPPGRFRRSLAWYYYTAPRAADRRGHGTLFQARPGEGIDVHAADGRTLREWARDLTPPLVADGIRSMRRRARHRWSR